MISKVISTILGSCTETVGYYIWYFCFPLCCVRLCRALPIMRMMSAEVLGLVIGGLMQLSWMNNFAGKHPPAIDLILMASVKSRSPIFSAFAEIAGVLLACSIFAFIWITAMNQQSYTTLRQFAGLALLPSADPLEEIRRGNTEYATAILFAEFLMSYLHYWGIHLINEIDSAQMYKTYRCFLSPAFVMIGKTTMGTRPSLTSSVALIAAIMKPHKAGSMLLLGATDMAAAVVVAKTQIRTEKKCQD